MFNLRALRFKSIEPAQPVSKSYYRVFIYSLTVLTGFAISWLFIGKTEQTIQVTGLLSPLGSIRSVQLTNGGVVDDVLVKEGQFVEKGEVLLKLDASLDIEKRDLLLGQILTKESQLKHKRLQRKFSSDSSDKQIKKLANLIGYEKDKLGMLSKLSHTGAISQLQFLDQESRLSQLEGDLLIQYEQKNLQLSIIDNEIFRLSQELLELNKQLSVSNQNISYSTIVSPQAGFVFDLLVADQGYVGTSTESIMKIVPANNLVADINIPANKIGFVQIDADVEIAIDAFPSSDFGTINGVIRSISSSSLPPDKDHSYARYPTEVRLKSQSLITQSGSSLSLKPGMTVTANISLRQASYFQLIFSQLDRSLESLTRY